jgi:heavy metal sensor kinase
VTAPWAGASIRLRLTAWYTAVLAAMLILYATATFVAVRHEFMEQLDERLHEDFEAVEGLLTQTPDGSVVWASERHNDTGAEEGSSYEVWSGSGQPIHRSGSQAGLPPPVDLTSGTSYVYETIMADGNRRRALTAPISIGGHRDVLRVSRSEEAVQSQLSEVLLVLALGLPLVVTLAGVGGYVLAQRALLPIDRLASEARRITAERLDERLTVSNPTDEIGRLTSVINDTIARLESSFDQLRRFTADASHELRTPLAVVRGIGEGAVAGRRSAAEYSEAIGSMLEEVDRMTQLVDTLLRLSRGDAGTIRLSRENLELGQLAREAVSSLAILMDERNQTLTLDIADQLPVSVDPLALREAVTNVLDNAIKYSPTGSTISLRVARVGDRALLSIGDHGPGIPPEHRERIFHRFFRIDEARSRDQGGAGLGLAIAKWAVEIHDGTIDVFQRLGGGAEFRILLPLVTSVSPAQKHQVHTSKAVRSPRS